MSTIQTLVSDAFRSLGARVIAKVPHATVRESTQLWEGNVWSFLSFLPHKSATAIDLSVVLSAPRLSWIDADLATESGKIFTEMARIEFSSAENPENHLHVNALLEYIESQEPVIVEYLLQRSFQV